MSIEKLWEIEFNGGSIVFDLDNTIYEETDFLFAAFAEISTRHYKDRSREVENFLVDQFSSAGRSNLLDKLMEAYPAEGLSIDDLLSTLRDFRREKLLRPYHWFAAYCAGATMPLFVRIVTNGTPAQQRNKIASLDLTGVKAELDVVFANEIKPKPAPDGLRRLKTLPKDGPVLYVGDSEVDREFARACGVDFLDVAALKAGTSA